MNINIKIFAIIFLTILNLQTYSQLNTEIVTNLIKLNDTKYVQIDIYFSSKNNDTVLMWLQGWLNSPDILSKEARVPPNPYPQPFNHFYFFKDSVNISNNISEECISYVIGTKYVNLKMIKPNEKFLITFLVFNKDVISAIEKDSCFLYYHYSYLDYSKTKNIFDFKDFDFFKDNHLTLISDSIFYEPDVQSNIYILNYDKPNSYDKKIWNLSKMFEVKLLCSRINLIK